MTEAFATTLAVALTSWINSHRPKGTTKVTAEELETVKRDLLDWSFDDIEAWVEKKMSPEATREEEHKRQVIERLDEVIKTLEMHRDWMQGLQKQIDEATNQ